MAKLIENVKQWLSHYWELLIVVVLLLFLITRLKF